ncbi:MAG: nitronate monooxygenase [Bacteroidia bacterium]|nr:nitronate monooxygenase [Bacteroidia bacterium]
MTERDSFRQNRVCDLFGIQFPLIQAGMVWCSGYKLAAAVSNAGGLGLIGAGSMYPDMLREQILKCQQATEKPFGVNLPLLYPDIQAHVKVILEAGVKIVFTSAGNPALLTPVLKQNGVTVVHVVPDVRFALKAEASGVDAIVAEGFEAGGHNGRDEITSLVLIPQVRKATQLPLIAAGGIGTGAGMLASMVLGAEGVQIGSRFVCSDESSAHPAYKKLIVNAGPGDTRLTLKELAPVRLLKNKFYQEVEEAYAKGASREELIALLGRGRAKKGMLEGDLEEGELEIGQISGAIENILPAAEIVKEIIHDYQALRLEINHPQSRF